jgi:hypothetical protein
VDFGLKLPSAVRVHKIATLDKTMVYKKIGKVDKDTKFNILGIFNYLIVYA